MNYPENRFPIDEAVTNLPRGMGWPIPIFVITYGLLRAIMTVFVEPPFPCSWTLYLLQVLRSRYGMRGQIWYVRMRVWVVTVLCREVEAGRGQEEGGTLPLAVPFLGFNYLIPGILFTLLVIGKWKMKCGRKKGGKKKMKEGLVVGYTCRNSPSTRLLHYNKA